MHENIQIKPTNNFLSANISGYAVVDEDTFTPSTSHW
jgi:hypothetical protein